MIVIALLAHFACMPSWAQESALDGPEIEAAHRRAVRELARSLEDTTPGLELRLYPVARLTGELRRDALADELTALGAQVDASEAVWLVDRLRAARDEVDAMVTSLAATVAERMAPAFDEEVQRIEVLDGTSLALVGTPAQHAWLQAFLRRCEAFDGLIDVQARIYTVPREDATERRLHRSGEVLSAAQAEALLRELAGAEMVEAPRVIVRPLQEATLRAVEQVAYIGDYEIKVMPDEDIEVVDPIVMVAESGIVMSLHAVPIEDGRIAVDAELDFSSLRRPIPSLETTLGGKSQAPLTIQLPEIRRAHVEGGFDLAAGETLLLRTADPETGEDVLVLIRAERAPATRGR